MTRIVWRNDDPPDYPEGPCDVCGKAVDNCICPECPNCETTGDPNCYSPGSDCGLVKSQRQIDSYAEAEASWREEAEAENRFNEIQALTEAFGLTYEQSSAMSNETRRCCMDLACVMPFEELWIHKELDKLYAEQDRQLRELGQVPE